MKKINSYFRFFLNLTILLYTARLAQSVEHETLNLGVVGSSPTLGDTIFASHITNTILLYI